MIQIDMEIPKSCLKCEISALCKVRQKEYVKHIMDKTMDEYYDATEQGRLPNCPLKELPPHGDLIDISEVVAVAERLRASGEYSHSWEEYMYMALAFVDPVLGSNR